MNRYVKVLLVALLIVAIQHFANLTYIYFSFGNTVVPHYPGKCEQVKGITTYGSEDITLLPTGQAIITSGEEEFTAESVSSSVSVGGRLYVINTTNDINTAHSLTLEGWPPHVPFKPHGLDHWVHENESISIFVVLHTPERVARFLYNGEMTLSLTKVYENSKFMRNLNSVFCTGEDSFYLSNFMYARNFDSLMAYIEFLLYMPISNVLYVEGDNYKTAVDGLHFPNGLTGDSRYVYVATKGAVRIFSRSFDNTLRLYKVIPLNIGSIDNVKLDSSGNLWVGCQNIFGEVAEYIKDPRHRKCHSTVIRVRDPTGVAQLESVFVDDTSLIQAASVGVYSQGKLLIGSVSDKMITCDVSYLHEP